MPKIEEIRKQAEFWRFIKWISLPADLREPKTQKELAKELEVDYATLSDWKKVEGFWEEVRKLRKEWIQDKVSNILLGVYGKALKGDVNAAKLLLEYAGEFIERKEFKHYIEEELSEEEKEEIKKALEYARNLQQNNRQSETQKDTGNK